MLNQTAVIGRITTKHLTVNELPNEKRTKKLEFRIAVAREYRDKSTGQYEADFFSVVVFGATAEFVAAKSGKGKRVGVTGRLKSEEWEKDGIKNSRVVVVADSVDIIDWPEDADAATAPAPQEVAV